MRRLFLYIAIAAIIFLTISVAILWPKLSITTRIEQYEGEKKVFAAYALKQTDLLLSGSIEPFMVLARRVSEIKLVGTQGSCGYEPFLVHNHYEAKVELYTFFGKRYGLVEVTCDETQIERY